MGITDRRHYMKHGDSSGDVRAREGTVGEQRLEASDQHFSAPELHVLESVVIKANLMSALTWRANSKMKTCNQLTRLP